MDNKDKQAVLLIHGVGEQRPMETLRGFVKTVWSDDESVHHPYGVDTVWSKPDTISDSFELRRLTTGQNADGVRTDFFEFYWAHMMEGTSAAHVIAWARIILLRWPWKLPGHLVLTWTLIVGLILVFAYLVFMRSLPEHLQFEILRESSARVVSALVALVVVPVIKKVVGDAARYLNATPGNIKRRQEIRTKGVDLLQKLHEAGYKRVIVVGHSLGSVIGYDILTYAWALHNRTADKDKDHPKLGALESDLAARKFRSDAYEDRRSKALDQLKLDQDAGKFKPGDYKARERVVLDKLEQDPVAGEFNAVKYQIRQREVLRELTENGLTWRVTDFVTLGSPLAHAEILMAKHGEDLDRKQNDREFPICPPVLEDGRFSYKPPGQAHRAPHHAAVFGLTRWTNLYFPTHFVIHGDQIGGPVSRIFGRGVRDVPVSTHKRLGFFSHTLYWNPGSSTHTASHIDELRNALNLLDT
ncbi:MAG: hypothetical protein IH944_02790 [Armatimonadetes bacterium]|nr:hypothetical protein [Armatimonadota bacterium]